MPRLSSHFRAYFKASAGGSQATKVGTHLEWVGSRFLSVHRRAMEAPYRLK